MTVSSQVTRADYNGNGVTTLFSVPFYFVDQTHLSVLSTVIATGVSTKLTLGTDYTVAGVGVSTGGSITMAGAPAGTVRVTILRNVPYTQNTHYVPNDPFPASSHEAALDLLTMEAQQINEILSRTVTFPSSDPTGIGATIPNAVARAGKVFTFDSDGAPNVSIAAVDVTAVAANEANINIVSAAIAYVTTVANNIASVITNATNIASIVSVATSIASVITNALNIASINTNATNITAIQNASTNATNAANSATAAATSATSAATSLDNFKKAYQGAYAGDPTLRYDGSALQTGDLAYNTVLSTMRVYKVGTGWSNVGVQLNPISQTFSGTGAQTAYTLSASPGVAAAIIVLIGGVGQTPTTDYTVSGTTLTFTSAPPAGTNNITVINFGQAGNIAVPANSSVGYAALDSNLQSKFAMKNRIINGDLRIWQRGTTFTAITPSLGVPAYTSDRWFVSQLNSQSATDVTQQTGGATKYSIRVQKRSGSTGTSVNQIGQVIESVNCLDLPNKTVVLSFTAKAGANYSATSNNLLVSVYTCTAADQSSTAFINGTATGQSTAYSANVQLTTSNQQFITPAIAIPPNATNVCIVFAEASAASAAGANDWFELSDVQLEAGSSATGFDYRQYGTELALCQRYLPAFNGANSYGVAITYTTNTMWMPVQFHVPTRVVPTGIATSALSNFTISNIGTPTGLGLGNTGTDGANIVITYPAISGTWVLSGGGAAQILFTGCEL